MNKKAFTLVETLVTTCILAFLLLGLYIIFGKGYSAWEKGNIRLEQYQKARGCLDLMSRELKSAFISSSNSALVFRGGKDEILFFSSSNIPHEKGEYDLKEVEYKLENCNLVRKVKSFLNSKINPGATAILASNVTGLEFSYHNGKRWQESWDSTKEGNRKKALPLPQAIRIELVISEENESPLTFSTVINIPVK